MNILITDDHVLFRDGLRLLLEPLDRTMKMIEASHLQQALELCSGDTKIDLILLEMGAPGVDGLTGLRALHQRLPEAPIVVLGASQRRDDVLAALESGASGYIPRAAKSKQLLGALRLVLSGEIYVPSMVLAGGGAAGASSGDGPGSDFRGPLARLTARQHEVLMLLAQGRSNAQIARAIGIRLNTAKNHVKAILKALGVSNRTQAVMEAMHLGLRPPGVELS